MASSKIRVLDEITINKIAAGEVIENPASVVKELVENASDAGATEISLEIKGGGRQLIRITDNGSGMSEDDALLCLERHGTSKIQTVDDIYRVSTRGFRGEAIPSIASISTFTLMTRTKEDEHGTIVKVEGGRVLHTGKAPCAPGTTIEVQSLFFNVPVRKKFQRSPAYDIAEIEKIVVSQSLACPSIKFTLISNQKTLISTKKMGQADEIALIRQRVEDVLGKEFLAGLIPVSMERQGYKLLGFCGHPSFTRHNRSGQHLFINQRAVFSPLVSFAVKEGYGSSLPENRYPVFVLFLSMDSSLVDVNVHPQKKEVRLREEYRLREMISSAIQESLQGRDLQPSYTPLSFQAPAFSAPSPPRTAFHHPQATDWTSIERTRDFTPQETASLKMEVRAMPCSLLGLKETATSKEDGLQAVAALKGYIILISEKGALFAMDQRAAHSRVIYEQYSNPCWPVQSLLLPLTLDFSPSDAAILREYLDALSKTGLALEEFGPNSFILHSLPQILSGIDVQGCLAEIIEQLREFRTETVCQKEIRKKIGKTVSTAAFTNNTRLSLEEGQHLYLALRKCQSYRTCPFGKETLVEITEGDIGKIFNS